MFVTGLGTPGVKMTAVDVCRYTKRAQWMHKHAGFCVALILAVVLLFAFTALFAWKGAAWYVRGGAVLGVVLALLALHCTFTLYRVSGQVQTESNTMHERMLVDNPDAALNPEHQDSTKFRP